MKFLPPISESNQAFYFIPDISGFSGFVENTAIEHSIHIISELLEILLDHNALGFELAEIEGDALFMYLQEELTFSQIENQVSVMLNSFRVHLKKYEHQRICNCGACSSAIDLKIKFLLHKGRLDFLHVKNIRKPYGRDVIRIHRLLKNEVPFNEYLLLSNPVIEHFHLDAIKEGFKKIKSAYDIPILPYYYKELTGYKKELKNTIHMPGIAIDEEADLIIKKDLKIPIEKTFELISNFKYRKLWDPSLNQIFFNENQVNRPGSKHTCIIGDRKLHFETIAPDKNIADMSYGESTFNLPMTKEFQFYILLDKIDKETTRLQVLNFLTLNWMGEIMKKHIYRKIETRWNTRLNKLEEIGSNPGTF